MDQLESYDFTERKHGRAGWDFWICLFLLVATIALFWQVRSHDFIYYDDDTYVTANSVVKNGLAKDGIAWAFTTQTASNWHPLTWISHMLDVELYGMNPGAHHTTNVIFHAINAMLLFLLLRKMTGHVWPSCLAAFLFAVHPMHVESVAWISERKDVLSAFFFLLSLFAYDTYVRKSKIRFYLLMVFFLVAGLLSKPMLVTFPFLLLLLDYWPLNRFSFASGKENERAELGKTIIRLLVEKIPLLAIAVFFCLTTLSAQSGTVQSTEHLPLGLRISNALLSYVMYLAKMVLPIRLAIFYPYDFSIRFWQAMASFAALVLVTVLFLVNHRRRPYLIVGWLWFLGTLVPVIGLVQVGWQSMADRYTYIPYIGIFLSLSLFLAEISTSKARRAIAVGLSLLYCTGMVLAAEKQIGHWKNSFHLLTHALEVNPSNHVAHNNLGTYFLDHGLPDKAMEHYEEATRIAPGYAQAHISLKVVRCGFRTHCR